jgi:hypothetical protein
MDVTKDSKVFKDVCARFKVDPNLLAAIVTVESTWDQLAFRYEPTFMNTWKPAEFARIHRITSLSETVGQRMSYGLTQIMGGTARWLGFTEPLPKLFDPAVNLEFGVRWFVSRTARYEVLEDAIAAYNFGSAKKDPLTGQYANQEYVDKVLNALK